MANQIKHKLDTDKYACLARRAGAEGIVLLRNEGGTLPLKKGQAVSIFGRNQFEYVKSGTGSGGMVNVPYVVGILDAIESHKHLHINQDLLNVYKKWHEENPMIRSRAWGSDPWSQAEMPMTEKIAKDAREKSDAAIVVIMRNAGESRDNTKDQGSYLLTDEEEQMLEVVCGTFRHVVVVLNVGNIMDMKWVEKYKPSAVLYAWQGGQEGGNSIHDVLTGAINPCAGLSGTIAYDIEDYPSTANYGDDVRNFYEEDIYVGYRYFETVAKDRVLYPFGFGLSYTSFENEYSFKTIGSLPQSDEGDEAGGYVELSAKVKNTGEVSGKEIIQVYLSAPQEKLGKPARVLIGFAKTGEIKSGESETLSIKVPYSQMASYDDGGATGNKSCFVLESGIYTIFAGRNVRDAKPAGSFDIPENLVTQKLTEALAPVMPLNRMKAEQSGSDYKIIKEPAPLRTYELSKRVQDNLPCFDNYTGDKGIKLSDVFDGKSTMKDLVSQLSDFELCCLVRGEGMSSPKTIPGSTGVYGGVTKALAGYGIPIVTTCDGPSGIRLDSGAMAFNIPNGTAIACSFNTALATELFEMLGQELRKNMVDMLLGPGMNIHRNPLNGRNFEYFSEDPLLSGKMAAAELIGLSRWGVAGVIKHFAANNQEHERNSVDGVISERALREIYLKGFEIAVKEGKAEAVMSTYGPINGIWTAGNYDLLTTILRGEWGFDGIVMTDWWADINDEGGVQSKDNFSAMVRAQNDIYMVVDDSENHKDNLAERLKSGAITRGELLRSAENICGSILKLDLMPRLLGRSETFEQDINVVFANKKPPIDNIRVSAESDYTFDLTKLDTTARAYNPYMLEKIGDGALSLFIKYRTDAHALSQNPIAILIDNKPVAVCVLNGTNNKLKERTIEFDVKGNEAAGLEIFFSGGNIMPEEIKLSLKEFGDRLK